MMMKRFLTALLVALLFASPAFAEAPTRTAAEPTATFEPHAIADKEDAIAQAKLVWASEGISWDTTDLKWSCTHNYEDEYIVSACGSEVTALLQVAFDTDTGAVNFLTNVSSRFDFAEPQEDAVMDAAKEAELEQTLLQLAQRLHPSLVTELTEITCTQQSVLGNQRFAEFKSNAVDGNYQLFELQLEPQLRLVFYSAFTPVDDGMGNG